MIFVEMEQIMRKLTLAFLLIGILVLVPAVGAQAALSFDLVQIQFWPEYDRPEMLVIYTFELPAEQSLPVEMSARIPARVGAPTAVAVLEGTQLVTREYSVTEEGDWAVVTLTTDSSVIHMEYYDPAFSQSDRTRKFPFEWSFDYPVDELVISFKQPVNATDVTFSTDLGAPAVGADNLDFYSASVGALPAGENLTFSIEYQKPDTLLSAEFLAQASPQTDTGTEAPAAQNQIPDWGWYVIGIGALTLAGGGIYLWYANSPAALSNYRQKKARSTSRPGGSSGSGGGFCHQCGTPASKDDKFCRECGTKLRK